MVSLSASCVNWKLVAEATTQATENLILEFLNGASSAGAVAGWEPSAGPIADDPKKGYGDRCRDYDIGFKVAQRIINKRDNLDEFTSLTTNL